MRASLILVMILCVCLSGCSSKKDEGASSETAGTAAKAEAVENAGAKAETAKAAGAEAKAAPESEKAAQAPAVKKYVDASGEPLGLQLDIAAVLPGEVIDGAHQVMDNGIYRMTWIYNGMVSYSLERLPKAELGEDGVRAAFAEIAPFAYDASLRPDDDMTRRLGAVAWKWFYSTGRNEDLRTNTDYYIQRDDFDYRFSVSVPADFADEYKQVVKSLVNGLVFVTR